MLAVNHVDLQLLLERQAEQLLGFFDKGILNSSWDKAFDVGQIEESDHDQGLSELHQKSCFSLGSLEEGKIESGKGGEGP